MLQACYAYNCLTFFIHVHLDYVPKMPSHADLELIFDTSYPDVQPYLFKISHATSMPTSPSMGTAVRRLIRDTLTFS